MCIAFSVISSHVFLVVHRRLYHPACLLNCSQITVLQQLCGLQSKTFLSKTISLLVMVSFSIHVSHAYVTTGLITEQYNFNFAILDISLLWIILVSYFRQCHCA